MLEPPKKESPSEFIANNRYLSSEVSASPGRWKNIPYQKEMMDVTEDPRHNICIYMLSTQTGKTECLKNLLFYRLIKRPAGCTWLLPSISMARDFSSAQLETMIRDNKLLRDITPDSRKDGASRLFKKFPGAFLRLVGGQKSDQVSSFPSPIVFADEIDRIPMNARSSSGVFEGNILHLLLQRMTNYPPEKRLALFTSTPTLSGTSAIEDWFLKSDQRYPYVKCRNGHYNFLKWESFQWKNKDSKAKEEEPEEIFYPCGKCDYKYSDANRYKWLPTVKWQKKNPKSDIAGFHLNAFYSPWVSWSSIVGKWLAAKGTQTKEMVFFNTSLGLPYRCEQIEKPDYELLHSKEKKHKRGVIPKEVTVLLASCDVQGDRLEVQLIGWNRKKAYIIDYFVFDGNTFDLEAECWSELNELLKKKWTRRGKAKIEIKALSIDAQFNSSTVGKFARSKRKVYPVNGLDRFDVPVHPPKPMMIKSNGKWIKTGKKRWPISSSLLKMDVYNRLKLGEGSKESISFCSGLPEEYYKQLTAESLDIVTTKNNSIKHQWVKNYHNNEALDTLANNLGLHTILFGNWSEERWESHENKS